MLLKNFWDTIEYLDQRVSEERNSCLEQGGGLDAVEAL